MHILKTGHEGIEVANWQRFLISQGFKEVEADGDFGPKTEAATKVFQASQNLRADGIVGDNTFDAAERIEAQGVASIRPVEPPRVVMAGKMPAKLLNVHPNLADKALQVLNFAKAAGFTLIVTEGLRTFAEQDKLFRKRPRVTQARGGQSQHNYGLAVDFAFMVDGKLSWDEALYRRIGPWARLAGLEWGGDWKRFVDMPHCHLKGLPSYKVLLPIFNAGGLRAVWEKYKG